ncbi:glycosyltransferase family 4 protein [Brevundimonas intermedia]|uniref:glycosyltransferase family 4 protein n=1 Tax=Brevundimonas intermedia TaxID=74315 RepID=UPI0032088100
MSDSDPSFKVVVICPWFFARDAVGAAARDTYLALKHDNTFDVSAIYTVNDYDDVSGICVSSVAEMILEPTFLDADVLIYVFAVYHELFDALLVGNGKAQQIVRFHNVTPKSLMPEKHWPIIDRSFVQITNFSHADEIWADSQENFEELLRQGDFESRTLIVPIAVPPLVRAKLSEKPIDTIEMAYVGRFFESKGVLDVVRAAAMVRSLSEIPFRVRLFGNLKFSDPEYVLNIRQEIKRLGVQEHVDFVGSATPEALAKAYRTAHIYLTGSRHEGFCVPVIEGLAAGCLPVSYNISNLRFIGGGLGRLAIHHTPAALADQLVTLMSDLHEGRSLSLDIGKTSVAEFDAKADDYVRQFAPSAFESNIRDLVKARCWTRKSLP